MLTIQGLHIRAALFRFIRSFFFEQGFLEVDTPVRQPVLIPESTIVPLSSEDHFLQTSPELCMKRLLAAGSDRIFQICPCFRQGEKGKRHLEEFTMLEWYRKDADYSHLMEDCDALLAYIVKRMDDLLPPDYPGRCTGLSAAAEPGGGERKTVEQAFSEFSPVSLQDALVQDRFDEVLVEYVEPNLGKTRPLFLYDYPAELASLAKMKSSHPVVAERFELYIRGMELANGFSELTDPAEQRSRFEEELREIEHRKTHSAAMPVRFLEELGRIDTAAGIAFGLDRLLMLLMGKEDVAEVVTFPPHDL